MKNNIHIMQVLKVLFSFVLIFTLIVAIPMSTINVYAALKEDCDLDGFDDATGLPVPWPGYDETKGDTASGPGTATTPTTAATTAPTKAATTTPTTAAITTAPTTASTNNASVDTTNNTGTTNTSSTNNSTSTGSNAVSGSTANSGSVDSSVQSTVVEVNSDAAATVTVQSTGESVAPVSADAIINTKGSLKIIDAKGSIIHAGSSIIISGSGFSGNSAGLEIVIHSEPVQLGTVTSLKDGSFDLQIDIPDNLEAGTHNIVVSYQGKEITSQQIVVAPKAADTFLGALTVGFSAENKGLIPGLLILAGLIIAGGVALLVSGIANARRSKNVPSEVVLKK